MGLPHNNQRRHNTNNRNACALHSRGGKSDPKGIYYYDFAMVADCGNVDACLDAFLKQMGLREVQNSSSYMSNDELCSLMDRYDQEVYSSLDEPFER